MYFNKVHNPQNFLFPESIDAENKAFVAGRLACRYQIDDIGGDVFRLTVQSERWPKQYSQAPLSERVPGVAYAKLMMHDDGVLRLAGGDGFSLIESSPGRLFGVSGNAWMLCFSTPPQAQFFGMGEKNVAFERSGIDTKFWNTDVWADFHGAQCASHPTDPMYVSVPYLIVKNGNDYAGILVNNPFAVFMSTPPELSAASKSEEAPRSDYYIGAPEGLPELYFIAGPSLAELTSKLQRLVGTTPLPPLWALGHQQCRWGYAGYKDLDGLDRKFKRHRIPDDGLWLDIDYMDGYRVFTFSPKHWSDPKSEIEEIRNRGRRVVPILDPGVKVDPGYDAYNELLAAKSYCTGPEGIPFQGYVWPGLTIFPDFSTEEGRLWWAERVAKWAENGVSGAWLDMNDPAVGRAELEPMRFGKGGENPHDTFHNQYALGMAKASRQGFLQANPDTRPFLLTRSGFIGSNRYAAVWTGDNMSNAWFLKQSLPVSLNLALSGIPFNGADVCGFGGDADRELAIAWYKAAFLMPFFRNHCNAGSRFQEPWRFDDEATQIIRRYIRLRYKLLPYIYNLFIDQEETGSAIARPLFYDFEDTDELPLGKIDDQYMLGSSILHAPILVAQQTKRSVALPEGIWFDAVNGRWIDGGTRLEFDAESGETPIFIRDGAIIPMLCGEPTDNKSDLSMIEIHLFLCPHHTASARYTYRFDDGESFAYKRGERTVIGLNAWAEGRRIKVDLQSVRAGYKPASVQFVAYGDYNELELTINDRQALMRLRKSPWQFAGKPLSARISASVEIG
jgi:alpha-glucosidase